MRWFNLGNSRAWKKFIEFEQLDAESAAKALESSINELEYWNIIAKELGTKARHYWTWEARAKAFLEFGRVSLRQNQGGNVLFE